MYFECVIKDNIQTVTKVNIVCFDGPLPGHCHLDFVRIIICTTNNRISMCNYWFTLPDAVHGFIVNCVQFAGLWCMLLSLDLL